LDALVYKINAVRWLISTPLTQDSIIVPRTVVGSFNATQRYNREDK